MKQKGKNIEIIKLMYKLQADVESLNSEINLGIIDASGARDELELLNIKQQRLRDQLVFSNHVTNDGQPRNIKHHTPTDGDPKDYYITIMADGKRIKAVSYDKLIDKLYNYYADGLLDFSVASVFNAALNEKAVTENPKPRTIEKNRGDFKRFISDDFAKKDIRTISEVDLKKFIQEWVTETTPKKKTFLSFKGILNMIFEYAYMHKIIVENPVSYVKNRPYMKSCDTSKAKSEEKIFSPEEIQMLKDEVRRRINSGLKRFGDYYINGYAMLFAIETVVRVGELCALKWEDIHENYIHIHSQQLFQNVDGKKEVYYAPYTKNEKGISEDGRQFPLTNAIASLLGEIKEKQKKLGIESEFIFCNEDGRWIIEEAYTSFLRRLCRSKGLTVTNNHAFRMSLNSNVLIPMGISVADRAAMLGHSIETNLKYYSYAQKDYLEDVKAKLDAMGSTTQGTPGGHPKIVPFAKKESLENLNYQAF
ncbi:Site-specific recombinase XerD [Pseudobutyrivibrio sp. UC1225]|uniref:tyrosine-type recombinase/integrase n=1 Tax=Pseudobutyrivibrio sp. UC1225 TaxID=1798185 RepID=UPI0008EA4907|nr:tyrosine-type recombinase/integrase [Pseudobutyrivibrio sp. UC1225]SFN93386.1 Site-specific recombinase XerD [Pseudobutyrivibrio sp. UC1225]